MVRSVTFTVGSMLGALAALHLWWAARGIDPQSVALPSIDGRPSFVPSRLSAVLVALALSLAAALVLWRGGVLRMPLPSWVASIGSAGVGVVLVARAFGDLRLVGFCKSVRGTRFALWDTLLFSPLCLTLGLACLWVAFSRGGARGIE